MLKVLLVFCLSSPALAIEYFGTGIDYWGKKGAPATELAPVSEVQASVSTGEKAFNWEKHMNPQNPEFFKEGEHTPPEPFMELVRNPNDENIRNWFALVEAKNRLFARMSERMQEYAATHKEMKAEERTAMPQAPTPIAMDQAQRFRFRLYFDSQCPHCERMISSTLAELSERGYYVELRQIDSGKPTYPVPFPATLAGKDELDSKQINSTPVLFVGDTVKSVVYRIDGFRTTQEVLGILLTK